MIERFRDPGHLLRWGLGVGGGGFLLLALGLLLDPRQALASYLAAYATAVALALGALVLVMISHVLTAHWFLLLRRLAESVAGTLPLLAVLFLPLALDPGALYPWVPPLTRLAPHLRELVQEKHAYLNLPFFYARAAFYLLGWSALALLLRRGSLRQDNHADDRLAHRLRALGAFGLVFTAFTLSFAAFDWLMSLSPGWYSTIYGVYFFASGFLGALALLTLLAYLAEQAGVLDHLLAREHYAALGKMLLTFVVFWGYIAFSQILILWIGDIPLEITWLYPRLHTSWAALGIVLLLGLFAGPFLLLLLHDLKRRPRRLATLAAWIVLMVYLDLYWLVMPEIHPGGVAPHWLDVAAIAAVGGACLAFAAWRLRGHLPVPAGDPDFRAAVQYEGH